MVEFTVFYGTTPSDLNRCPMAMIGLSGRAMRRTMRRTRPRPTKGLDRNRDFLTLQVPSV